MLEAESQNIACGIDIGCCHKRHNEQQKEFLSIHNHGTFLCKDNY